MRVYLVWYENDLGKCLWGIFKTFENVERVIKFIKENYGWEADWTDETILDA